MTFFLLLALWLLFNWVAPMATMVNTERISPGRLPRELFAADEARRVRFYLSALHGRGWGFSVWAAPWSVVVFDRAFFMTAPSDVVRYVIAHELGHHHLGHHWRRWWLVVFGVAFTPLGRRVLAGFEQAADLYAFRLTGLTPEELADRYRASRAVEQLRRQPL